MVGWIDFSAGIDEDEDDDHDEHELGYDVEKDKEKTSTGGSWCRRCCPGPIQTPQVLQRGTSRTSFSYTSIAIRGLRRKPEGPYVCVCVYVCMYVCTYVSTL